MSTQTKDRKLDERVETLEEFVRKLKLLVWFAAILGVSVGGAITYLWTEFRAADASISKLGTKVGELAMQEEDVQQKANQLEKQLHPEVIQQQAREALSN